MVELKREVNRDSTLTLTCDNSSTLSHFSRDLHHDLMFLLIQCAAKPQMTAFPVTAVYESGTETRGQDTGTRVWGLGTWGRETRD